MLNINRWSFQMERVDQLRKELLILNEASGYNKGINKSIDKKFFNELGDVNHQNIEGVRHNA